MKQQTNQIEWRELKIEDACELITDFVANGSFGTLKKNVEYKHREDYAILLRLKDYSANFREDFVYITKRAYEFLSKSKVYPGDIILSNVGSVGSIFIAPDLKKPMSLGPNAVLIRFKGLNKFLFYLFKSDFGQKLLRNITSKTSQPKFNKTELRKTKISLPFSDGKPDLKEQERIVKILEKAEKLKERGKKAEELLDEYLKSVFNEMFYNKGFEKVKLSNICETSSGGTPSRTKKEYWEKGMIPWIKSGDLNRNKITAVDEFITEVGLKNSSAKYIEADTVLIAMYGATAGKTSISKIKATTNQAVCALAPKNKNLNKTYLLYWLRSKYSYIVSLSFGGGQPNISQQVVRSLKIPLPPLQLQQKFAKIVKQVEKMKENVNKTKANSEELFNSLMQRAFSGELIK